MAQRYQLLKNGVPVCIANGEEECDDLYAEHDCDEVRELNEVLSKAERYGYDTDTCMANVMDCGGL